MGDCPAISSFWELMVCRGLQLLTQLMLTSCAWAALPGLHHGYNTSIGNETDRLAAAKHFNFTVADDEQLWRNNSLTPFVGKVLRATKIKIIRRNFYNRVIEWYINHNVVHWTVTPGPQGIKGDIIEDIDGTYTRRFMEEASSTGASRKSYQAPRPRSWCTGAATK